MINMKIPLKRKSNIIIDSNNIKEITPVSYYEYPDVYMQSWFTFSVIYNDGKNIPLYYDTVQMAEEDRNFLLEKLNF